MEKILLYLCFVIRGGIEPPARASGVFKSPKDVSALSI